MGKQNVQGKKVYWTRNVCALSIVKCLQRYSRDRISSWYKYFLPFSFSCSCYCGRRRSITSNPVLEPTEIELEMLANMSHLVSMPQRQDLGKEVWTYSSLPGTTSLCNALVPALSLTCFVYRAYSSNLRGSCEWLIPERQGQPLLKNFTLIPSFLVDRRIPLSINVKFSSPPFIFFVKKCASPPGSKKI